MKIIAYEFLHPNGHAIVDYSERTHVGDLTAEKGYKKLPLVYPADAIEAAAQVCDGMANSTSPHRRAAMRDAAKAIRRLAAAGVAAAPVEQPLSPGQQRALERQRRLVATLPQTPEQVARLTPCADPKRHTTQCKRYDNNCGAVHPSNCPDCPFRTRGVKGSDHG